MKIIISIIILLLSYACADTILKNHPADFEIIDTPVSRVITDLKNP